MEMENEYDALISDLKHEISRPYYMIVRQAIHLFSTNEGGKDMVEPFFTRAQLQHLERQSILLHLYMWYMLRMLHALSRADYPEVCLLADLNRAYETGVHFVLVFHCIQNTHPECRHTAHCIYSM